MSPPAQSGWAWPQGEQRPRQRGQKRTGRLLWEVGMLDKVASGSGGAGGRNLSVPAPLEGWWGHLGEEFCGDNCELTAE